MATKRWQPPSAANLGVQDQEDSRNQVSIYLHRFGHLEELDHGDDGTKLTSALSGFQHSSGLPETGKYDDATVVQMSKPRCGIADHPSSPRTGKPQSFTIMGNKWDHEEITYRFDSWCNDLNQQQVRSAISRALSKWAEVSPLTFREVPAGTDTDIRIQFAVGNHGDGLPFDNAGGPAGNTLAHAFSPGNDDSNIAGDCHFDDFEVWTEDYLHGVALHEFGHSIGLNHSEDAGSVMYAFYNGVAQLQPDDIAGVQSRYGRRTKGWFAFQLEGQPTVSERSGVAAVSRRERSMEVWWIRADGAVIDGYWNDEPHGWGVFELAGAGSASPGGGIAAVSRASDYLEIFWVGLLGSIEGAWWSQGMTNWGRQRLSPEGTAARNSRITAVSRIKDAMELWWVAPNGSVQGCWWTTKSGWNRYELAPAGSAAAGSGIKVVARHETTMEIWWVSPNGSIVDAYWYEDSGWNRFDLAPPGSAAIGSGVAAVSRVGDTMEVWWIGPNGSIQDAYWYGDSGWGHFELAGPGTAAIGGIEAVSRIEEAMEVWWTGPNGNLQDGYCYRPGGWTRFELAPPNSTKPGTSIAAVSRVDNSMEIWLSSPTGSVIDRYWYGA